MDEVAFVGAVTMTSQQVCVGSTGRRSPQGSTGSSTSRCEEDRKTQSLEAENKELRARIEPLEIKAGGGAQGGQGLPSRRDSGWDGGRVRNGHGP